MPVLILPVNTTETWASHFTSRSWTKPADQIAAGYPRFIQPTAASGSYEEVFDLGQTFESSSVNIEYTADVIAGTPNAIWTTSVSPDGTTWEIIGSSDGFATNFRYVKVNVSVTDASGLGIYAISQLNVTLSAKLKNEGGNSTVSSSDTNGTIVNFTELFIDVTSITLTGSGTTPVTPVYNFKDQRIAGTYSVTSNVCTVNATAHDLVVGQKVRLFFTSGGGIEGIYTVASVPNANSFTVTMTTVNTSGNCTMYPNGFRIFLFNSAGSRVSGTVSWSIKGY